MDNERIRRMIKGAGCRLPVDDLLPVKIFRKTPLAVSFGSF
jgi:hypothetical protein